MIQRKIFRVIEKTLTPRKSDKDKLGKILNLDFSLSLRVTYVNVKILDGQQQGLIVLEHFLNLS